MSVGPVLRSPDVLASRLSKPRRLSNFSPFPSQAIVLTEWYQVADHNELLEYRVKDGEPSQACQMGTSKAMWSGSCLAVRPGFQV